MRITLNLLPKKRKKKIRSGKILKLFVWLESMLIFTIVLLLGVVIGTNEVIDIKMTLLSDQLAIDSSEGDHAKIKEYEEALNKTKKDVLVIDKIQRNNINWVPVFEEINKSVPEGVKIESISNGDYNVNMLGVAESREKLINMKSQIEKNSCFDKIIIPINDIVLKNDIDFSIDFEVTKNCLVKYEE